MRRSEGQPNEVEQLGDWRSSAQAELDEAQGELALIRKRIELARERIALIDRLLALEEAGGNKESPPRDGGRDQLLDECERVIGESGKPVHISDLMDLLRQRNIPLPGRGTEANVIVRLRRADGRFVRTGRGMYGLPEFGLSEAKPPVRRKSRRRPRKS